MSKNTKKPKSNKPEKIIVVLALVVCMLVIGYAAKLKSYKPVEQEIGKTKADRIENIVSLQDSLFTVTEFEFGKVNINTASVSQLQRLEEIGEKRAQDIVDYREQNGPFTNLEDIMKVSGIGEKTFEKIKENIEI